MMFKDLIGKSIEVYVDDLLVKFMMVGDHIEHLNQMYNILQKYRMKLTPLKCAFGVGSDKFLGFMVNQHGIEANPEKIKVLLEVSSPKKPKEHEPCWQNGCTKSTYVTGDRSLCTC